MHDRFMRGALAGLAGAIVSMGVSLFLIFVLKFGTLRFYDIGGTFIYGRKPVSLPEIAFAEFAHLVVSGGVGVLYAFLMPRISSRYNLAKGVMIGIATWFAVYAMTVLFKVPRLQHTSLESSLSNVISSAVFGLVMAATLGWLDNRHKVQS